MFELTSEPTAVDLPIAAVGGEAPQWLFWPISGLPAITFHQLDPAASSANRVRNSLVSVLRRAIAGKQLGCHVTTAGRARGHVEVVLCLKQPAVDAIVTVGEEADVADFRGDIEDAVIGVGEAQAGDREAARGVARSSEKLADSASRPQHLSRAGVFGRPA